MKTALSLLCSGTEDREAICAKANPSLQTFSHLCSRGRYTFRTNDTFVVDSAQFFWIQS